MSRPSPRHPRIFLRNRQHRNLRLPPQQSRIKSIDMPQDVSPAVYKLQQPEKLSEVLADDRANYDDCMPCRLLGELSSNFSTMGANIS